MKARFYCTFETFERTNDVSGSVVSGLASSVRLLFCFLDFSHVRLALHARKCIAAAPRAPFHFYRRLKWAAVDLRRHPALGTGKGLRSAMSRPRPRGHSLRSQHSALTPGHSLLLPPFFLYYFLFVVGGVDLLLVANVDSPTFEFLNATPSRVMLLK